MVKYHVVLARVAGQPWGVQFGDYDWRVADQERRDMRQSGQYRARDLMTLTVMGDDQASINDAVAHFNAMRAITGSM